MNERHRELVDAATEAIDAVFSDTSVPREQTLESMDIIAETVEELRSLLQSGL